MTTFMRPRECKSQQKAVIFGGVSFPLYQIHTNLLRRPSAYDIRSSNNFSSQVSSLFNIIIITTSLLLQFITNLVKLVTKE